MKNIRIGTCVNGQDANKLIPQILPMGFESFNITFWQSTGLVDLSELGKKIREMTEATGTEISCVSIFGNALTGDGDNADTLDSWRRLIDNAHHFGTDLVTGFTGRLPGAVPASLPRFKEVFRDLAKRAADKGVRLAFENCGMGGDWLDGDWNIALSPDCWELMFDALPEDHLGLQWEPCHQVLNFIDPIPQLRKWTHKIFHVHGKDASIDWDVIREHGRFGKYQIAWDRSPGFGDTDWVKVIDILRRNHYQGNIDIEGYHDPVYKDNLEYTGQIHALNYLKHCRGGDYIPNPIS